jgi:aminoglycoside 2'-N-acetyltransferase I
VLNISVVKTSDLTSGQIESIRSLMDDAFDDFADEDWDHALGGWHVIANDGEMVAHAAVVERLLGVGERLVRTGYVEAVATTPTRQGQGVGTAVMRCIAEVVVAEFEMGALATGAHEFYERLGWERWQGPTFVRDGDALVRTADEDDGIMILRCPPTESVDRSLPVSCDARTGDDW